MTTLEIILICSNILFLTALGVSIYFNVKHGIFILRIIDSIESVLDILDEKYNSISKVLEIPLLFESKLMNYLDVIVFINAKKQLRLRRYLKKNNDKKIFNLLNRRQILPTKKIKMSDHVINNNKSLSVLKNSVKKIIKLYE